MKPRTWVLLAILAALLGGALAAATPAFDAKAATDAYLASVPAAQRARSDAYFQGGYWLMLWDFLFSAAILVFLLESGLSAGMRNLAERVTRRKAWQTYLYWLQFALVFSVLYLPLEIYEGFFRERQYGLMNQNLAQWFGDQATALALTMFLGGFAIVGLVGVVRRVPRTWHIWGAVVSVLFLAVALMIGPVFIAPLFNKYTVLSDPRIKDPILAMARANGIPATDVYEVDASRQSKRVSANVSGFLGTERITLNDNLIQRCTPEEVMAVMGHEMGHYVLHHIEKFLLFELVILATGFAVLRRSLDWLVARWGTRWRLRGTADVAALPAAALILSLIFFVLTPVTNSYVRTQEFEADMYGLNAARQPDAEAKIDLMLGEYRKLDPGPLEEMIFFDHPGGRTRIYAAMRWKAENLK